MTAVYRFIVGLIGVVSALLGAGFAMVATNPIIVVFVAFAVWVGVACLREARHPG